MAPHDLPNCNMRLYGGAQFHRCMSEFRVGVGAMACPTVTREEIVNACGMVSQLFTWVLGFRPLQAPAMGTGQVACAGT